MTFQDLSNNYSIKWSTSVNDITLSDWEDIFGKSIIKVNGFSYLLKNPIFSKLQFIIYKYLNMGLSLQ